MLEQDGVLERVNRGMRVRQTSSEEVLEIYGVRTILEAAAARDAAAKRSDYDLATLDRIFGTMAEAEGADPVELAGINRSFHRAIWQAARNRTLEDLLERLAVHLRVTRPPPTSGTGGGRKRSRSTGRSSRRSATGIPTAPPRWRSGTCGHPATSGST